MLAPESELILAPWSGLMLAPQPTHMLAPKPEMMLAPHLEPVSEQLGILLLASARERAPLATEYLIQFAAQPESTSADVLMPQSSSRAPEVVVLRVDAFLWTWHRLGRVD